MKARVYPKRGFVYKVILNYPEESSAPNEKHMVVVMQSNEMLKHTREVNVLEITSNLDSINACYNVSLPSLTIGDHQLLNSKIKCHFLYGIKKENLLNGEYCGQIPSDIMSEIEDAIIFSLGLLED